MIYLTLNQIRAFSPCAAGYKKLCAALNKTEADDEPIALSFILESNGLADAVWCMRVNWFEHKELYMKFVNNCAERAKEWSYAADYAAVAASAAADAVAAYLTERKHQAEYLADLLLNHS